MGTSGSFLTVAPPLEFLSSYKLRTASSLGAVATSGFLCRQIRGMHPHLDRRSGKQVSSCVVVGNSMFLSSGDGYVGELLELPKGCQVPFRGSRRKVGFLLRRCSRKGPHLALRGESPGVSPVTAGNLGFLSSCDGDLKPTHIASG